MDKCGWESTQGHPSARPACVCLPGGSTPCSARSGVGEGQTRARPRNLSLPDIAQHNGYRRSSQVLLTAARELGKNGLMSQTQSSQPPGYVTILLPPGMVRSPGSFGHLRESLSPREWKEKGLSPSPL